MAMSAATWWLPLFPGRPARRCGRTQPSASRELGGRLRGVRSPLRAARIFYGGGLRLRQLARSRPQVRAAAAALGRSLRLSPRGSALERRARERLALILCQERLASEASLDQLLRSAGYTHRLCSAVLRYRRGHAPAAPAALETAPSPEGMSWRHLARQPLPPTAVPKPGFPLFVAALDGALPAGMLRHLRIALGPLSPFWRSHGYVCDGVRTASPFFSYVHDLRAPARTGLDRVLRRVQAHAAAAQPAVAAAGMAEWWAHCRPHATGHQMHFDSADEGRGQGGPRHPVASAALYLSTGVGGPTLITDQTPRSSSLASRGYTLTPRANRLLVFSGQMLHGVIPGRGPAPLGRGGVPAHRISLMVAFWPTLHPTPADTPRAGRPFPYSASDTPAPSAPPGADAGAGGGGSGGGCGRTGGAASRGGGGMPNGGGGVSAWVSLFDWPQHMDGGGAAPGQSEIASRLGEVAPQAVEIAAQPGEIAPRAVEIAARPCEIAPGRSGAPALGARSPRPAPLERISPIWQPLGEAVVGAAAGQTARGEGHGGESDGLAKPIPIPPYDVCFQGF